MKEHHTSLNQIELLTFDEIEEVSGGIGPGGAVLGAVGGAIAGGMSGGFTGAVRAQPLEPLVD